MWRNEEEPSCIAVGNVKWYKNALENSLAVPQKAENRVSI